MSGKICFAAIEEHKVKSGETLDSLAKAAGMTWQKLAQFNWATAAPKEINRFLHEQVGCTKKTKDGKNYMFDDSDDPGIVYVPKKWDAKALYTTQKHIIHIRPHRHLIIRLQNEKGHMIPETSYKVVFDNGEERTGTLGRGGAKRLCDVPEGPFAVYYPDNDDILAKSIAANLLDACRAHDTKPIFGLLTLGQTTVQAVLAAYDNYFNEYTGNGLLEDIKQEVTDPDALVMLEGLLAYNELPTERPVGVGETVDVDWEEASYE